MKNTFRWLTIALDIIMVISILVQVLAGQGTFMHYFILVGEFAIGIPYAIVHYRQNEQRRHPKEAKSGDKTGDGLREPF